MAKSTKKNPSRRRASGNPYRGRMAMLVVLAIVSGFGYLWGKVQIDFRLRDNEALRNQRDHLKREVVHLRLQISTKSRYQRIVKLAQEQGLVFISTSRLKNLEVDMPDIRESAAVQPASYASVAPLNLFE